MKKFARTPLFGLIALVPFVGAFAPAGCWTTAPKAGGDDSGSSDATPGDANQVFTMDGGSNLADAATSSDAEGGATVSDASGASDAASDVDAADATMPSPFPSPALATGLEFGCRIDANQNVWCWGANQFGQAGRPRAPALDDGGPAQVALTDGGPLTATALALGNEHACAITPAGAVYCWGRNDWNQLGHSSGDKNCYDPLTEAQYLCNATPTPADAGVASPALIAAAGDETCVVGPAGAVQCWGDAGGRPNTTAAINGIVQLAMATDHTCVLVDGGAGDGGNGNAVVCWGRNDEDQISTDGCSSGSAAPFCLAWDAAVPSASAVAAGLAFTCATVANAGVQCFGDNTNGELGHPPASDNPLDGGQFFFNGSPTTVGGLGAVSTLVASGTGQAACALAGGTVLCWGSGKGVPTPVQNLPTAAMSALGAPDGLNVCGEADDGGVWCWSLAGGPGAALATRIQ